VKILLIVSVVLLLAACGRAQWQPAGPAVQTPELQEDHAVMADGYVLPLHRWRAEPEPAVTVLGVHGFGDYGAGFASVAQGLVEPGVATVYAYDQRGFGATERPGIWPGGTTLIDDLRVMVDLLRARHPDRPLFLVGESMGGAVVLRALTEDPKVAVDGAVLLAPAVWGFRAMPWYQRLGLWLMVRIAPGFMVSSEVAADLGIRATDDRAVMRALEADPLVRHEARIDTLYGLSAMMDAALQHPPGFAVPILLLYGLNDQVIPPGPTCEWLQRLEDRGVEGIRVVLYPEGYHMLTRYSRADQTLEDLAVWLSDPAAVLPSSGERTLSRARDVVCDLPPLGRRSGP